MVQCFEEACSEMLMSPVGIIVTARAEVAQALLVADPWLNPQSLRQGGDPPPNSKLWRASHMLS